MQELSLEITGRQTDSDGYQKLIGIFHEKKKESDNPHIDDTLTYDGIKFLVDAVDISPSGEGTVIATSLIPIQTESHSEDSTPWFTPDGLKRMEDRHGNIAMEDIEGFYDRYPIGRLLTDEEIEGILEESGGTIGE